MTTEKKAALARSLRAAYWTAIGEPERAAAEPSAKSLTAWMVVADRAEPVKDTFVRWFEIPEGEGVFVDNIKTGDSWIKRKDGYHSVRYCGDEDLGWYDRRGTPEHAAEPVWRVR